jgi:hypothetical protein
MPIDGNDGRWKSSYRPLARPPFHTGTDIAICINGTARKSQRESGSGLSGASGIVTTAFAVAVERSAFSCRRGR